MGENPKYNLITGMADDAIGYLRETNAATPDKPFFLYYVPGSSHAPHQPTQEWIDKFKGKFDMGWNAMRDEIFANQKRLGVIPADTQLTPWPDDLPKWDTLSADDKKMFARQAEVFAAYVAYGDHEIGRVIDEVRRQGKLDNTLIIYIEGDNGTSAEGSHRRHRLRLGGAPGRRHAGQGPAEVLRPLGRADDTPHMSVAWSWAFDTPFKWTKQVASYFGGTRQGMVMSWPGHITDKGGVRSQFHHVIDIVPTILEATGIEAPQMVNGIAQKPIEGVSMAYTWAKGNEDVPSHAHDAVFRDVRQPRPLPRRLDRGDQPQPAAVGDGLGTLPNVINGYTWSLYDLTKDSRRPTISRRQQPEKLKELQELFLVEAAKYNVLPLDNSMPRAARAAAERDRRSRRPSPIPARCPGLPSSAAPDPLARSFTITAEVEVPEGGGEGMLDTLGGRFGGYGLYLLKGKPVFTYNLLALERFRWEGQDALTPGKHTIVFDFTYDGPGSGKGGTGVLSVDGTRSPNRRSRTPSRSW